MFNVILDFDFNLQCPNDMDEEWKLYSFNPRHVTYKNPEEIGLEINTNELIVKDGDLKEKLKNGLAHFLSYCEHKKCIWFRKDSTPDNVQNIVWSVKNAGLLVWEHPVDNIGVKTFRDRAKDADCFLNLYTKWSN